MVHQSISRINNWLFTAVRLLIAPPFCTHCKKFLPISQVDEVFCDACSALVLPIASKQIPITQKYTLTVVSVCEYGEPVKSLILAKHWSDVVASRQLGQLVWQKTTMKNMAIDYLIPVPLHWTRFARRGFNQTHEMAQVLADKCGAPIVPLVCRIKKTKFQAELSQEQRSDNVKDAFELVIEDRKKYEGKHLWLVDDLMTTGSTLKMAARELCKLRPATIHAIVACRTR